MRTPQHNSTDLLLRPARQEDKPGALVLSAKIWDGEDYIPEVWDDWLAEELGELTVGVVDDRVVLIGKLTQLRPGSWWMEGLRVDPDYRGRGYAKALYRYHVSLAERTASGTLGLGTTSKNAPVHQIMAQSDFEHIATFTAYTGSALPPKDPSPLQLAAPADRDQITAWLADSTAFQAAAGLAEDQWTWYPLLDALDDELAEGKLFLWKPAGSTPAGLVKRSYQSDEKLTLGLVLALGDQLEALLLEVRRWPLVASRQLNFKAPVTDQYANALKNAGWSADWDFDLYIYRKQL